MESWQLHELRLSPRLPEVLSSSEEGRVVVAELASGQELGEHSVHERAWVFVVRGEVEASCQGGKVVRGGPGLLIEFNPQERHSLRALSDARILLLLAPWPGTGHPGAMSLHDKLYAHHHAARR
jgi:quercetin dioxygenase-like cupin family protein